jgi:hypothetical protein
LDFGFWILDFGLKFPSKKRLDFGHFDVSIAFGNANVNSASFGFWIDDFELASLSKQRLGY